MKIPATPLGSLLERIGLKQTWISRQTGIDTARLNRICRGHVTATDAEKRLIARALRKRVKNVFPVEQSDAVSA